MRKIKTTGQLREVLAKAILDVTSGTIGIQTAVAIHKLSKSVTDSLYSETRIAMFHADTGEKISKFGTLPIGDPNSKVEK